MSHSLIGRAYVGGNNLVCCSSNNAGVPNAALEYAVCSGSVIHVYLKYPVDGYFRLDVETGSSDVAVQVVRHLSKLKVPFEPKARDVTTALRDILAMQAATAQFDAVVGQAALHEQPQEQGIEEIDESAATTA